MHILILTQNYVPEPDPKMHILAKGLVARGHRVRVITGFPNYPYGVIYPGYRQKLVQREELDGVQVIRLPLYPDKSLSVVRRSLNYLSFSCIAALLGPFLCGRFDVLLVYHPPITLGIPAWLISRVRNTPFIFEVQDMWPETLLATKMVSNPWILKMLAKLGLFTYTKAAAITVISPGFKRNLIAKGVPEDKIQVIYNWAYESDFAIPPKNPKLAEEMGLKAKFNIMYAGNMGPAQGLFNVIKAAVLLTDLQDIQFVLIGSGLDLPELEHEVRDKRLSNVKLIPRQPMAMMPAWYALADAVMVHLSDDPLFAITIPTKTQTCLLSGRPVIASVNGDTAELIVKAQAGFPVQAMHPEDLARVVRELHALSPAEREAMGTAGRRYYLRHLAPDVQIETYISLFQRVLRT